MTQRIVKDNKDTSQKGLVTMTQRIVKHNKDTSQEGLVKMTQRNNKDISQECLLTMTQRKVTDNNDTSQDASVTITQTTSNDNDNNDIMKDGLTNTGLTQIQTRGKIRQGVLKWADNITHSAPRTERKTTTESTTPGHPKIYFGAKPSITSYMGALEDDTDSGSTLKIILRHVQLRDHANKELKTLKRKLKREKGINETPQHKEYVLQIRLTLDRIFNKDLLIGNIQRTLKQHERDCTQCTCQERNSAEHVHYFTRKMVHESMIIQQLYMVDQTNNDDEEDYAKTVKKPMHHEPQNVTTKAPGRPHRHLRPCTWKPRVRNTVTDEDTANITGSYTDAR
eukprot:gene3826-7626_t